jgi:hypothetical protein
MAQQHMGTRVILVLAAVGMGLPLLMGPGCPQSLEPLAVDAGADLTITVGSNAQLQASISGGLAPYTVAWQPIAGLNNVASLQPTFTPTATGQYTFTISVNDANGDVASDTVTVTVNGAATADAGHNIGGGNDDGDTGGNGGASTAADASPLVVDAGPDRTATVGASISLQGSYSGGQEPYLISWSPATSLVGANTLTPTFTPTDPGSFTFTLTVIDGQGTTEQDSMVVEVSQRTTLSKLSWGANYGGDGYQLLAEFSKSVDRFSAERVTSYRISGTETYPTSATLASDTRTVALVFSGVKVTPKTEFDIGVNTGVLDSNGAQVPAVKGLVPMANTEDTVAPTISAARWAVNYNGSYGVELVFSEAMDQSSVENARTYEIADGELSSVGFDATMGTDGRTVNLVFHGVPLSQAAKLNVGLLNIRDINGQKFERVDGRSISTNSLDLDSPLIVADSVQFVGNYAGGGYQVVLEINEAMDRVSAEDATAYKADGLAASIAKLGDEGRRVTLTYLNNTYSTTSKLSISGNKVKDINGRYLAAQSNLTILPASSTGASPGAPTLTWLKGSESSGYQLLARFNESMDKTTVENANNWRITGTQIHPTAVVLSTQTAGEEIAGRTAKLTFGDFGDSDARMSRTTKVDVSVGNTIVDVNGMKLAQCSCVILANAGDTTAPSVTVPRSGLTPRPVWGDILSTSGYSGDKYVVSAAFSETMDAASAMDRTNYYLAGNQPSSVALDASGRKAVLTFQGTLSGIMAADKLLILGNVRDINGKRTSSVVPLSIQALPDDVLTPAIDEVSWGAGKGPYEVVVAFDEVMDAGSATDITAYTADGMNPTAASMLPDGKTAVLVFGDAILRPSSELSIIGEVKDINGNTYDGSHGAVALPVAPQTRPEDDKVPPRLVSAVWALDSLDYRVIATFNEALDADTAGNALCYSSTTKAFTRVTAASATLLPGGISVEIVFTSFGLLGADGLPPSPFSKTATLSVRPSLGAVVTDMHGNMTNTSTNVGTNPQDSAALELPFAQATWANSFADGGYRLTVTFADEVLDAASAEDTANYRIADTFVNPTGTRLSGLDDVPRGNYAGRTVFLTFTTKALNTMSALDASLGAAITDMNNNGMPQVSELMISPNLEDTTPPTAVSAAPGLLMGLAVVTFDEAMDETTAENLANYSLADPADPAALPISPYAASLDVDGMTVYLQFDVLVQGLSLHVTGATDINGLLMTDVDLPL